jgi:hypothetical protein
MSPRVDLVLRFLVDHRLSISLATVFVLLACVLAVVLRRKRPTPEEVEHRRRLTVYRHGRILDGFVTDIEGDIIYFAYSVNGADYRATQNVSALRHKLPSELHRAIGPATLRYVVNNPANSIVVCEEWSGLRETE